MRRVIVFFWVLFPWVIAAQEIASEPLAIDDFCQWNTLSNPIISNDGSRIAVEQNPQQGDGLLLLRSNDSVTDTIPRGYKAIFGPENDFIVFAIKQPRDTLRNAKLNKVKKEDMPSDSLGIWVFERGGVVKFSRLKDFKLPEENARWIAFTMDPEAEEKGTSDGKTEEKKEGDDLVLYRIETGDTVLFRDITDWHYAPKGQSICFTREVKDSTGTISSLYRFDSSKASTDVLFSSSGWIRKSISDAEGRNVAFLFSQDTIKEKNYQLCLYKTSGTVRSIVDGDTRGMPVGWAPSEHRDLRFSEDGTRLFFGTAARVKPALEDTVPDDEKPGLDIWNWQDQKLQPQQKSEVEKEKKRSYLALYHLQKSSFVQLADPVVRDVQTLQKGNGDIALGFNDQPYLREVGWTGRRARDYYVIDLESGIKLEILKDKTYVQISPKGGHVVWYDPSARAWFARSTDVRKPDTIPMTEMLPVDFFDERHDRPADPSPYGIAGWSEDDRFVYLYDRYDIWRLDLSGERVPVNITSTYGRRKGIRLRYVSLDPEQEYIPNDVPLLLSAFDEETMEAGFFSADFGKIAEPVLLTLDRYHYGGVQKAKDAGRLLWTRERVDDFPDLWSSDVSFKDQERISVANPQQSDFLWPKVQLVEWTSFSGEKLKGLLYLPENLDPQKRYPLLLYFYERNSENIHRHQHPAPSRSIINKTFYTSNGYVVFVPDITYRVGEPGQSAYDAIVSGSQYLLNSFPFLDAERMGLQGQSWGGYQTAWLITRTDLFAAAMAGAPVSNMTSAYGGIRWATGLSRMFQYEQTQSRIGGTLWEKPLHYIENSPLFYAPRVNTPLLMMHNDDDGAVPWYQGIEFFVALRRLDKPVWMLSYNGEPHNLKAGSWANRMDLSRRMFQFFNHYLKGDSMPVWMEQGVPAVEKGDHLGY